MRRFLPGILIACTLAVAGLAIYIFYDLPSVDNLASRQMTPSVRILDRNGRLLYEMLPGGEGRFTPVHLASVPKALLQATISTEDATFYENPGVDISGILRAFWINLKGGETLAGGSTITQQLARAQLMTPDERAERSLRRKLRESFLAWQISRRYSKDQVLELYLNTMYYGGMAYGVEAASQTYFARPVSELDLAESALLVGLVQSPGMYNPYTDPQAAKKRQETVLEIMQKHGVISEAERQQAASEPLVYASSPYPIEAPHFVMMVEAQLDQILPAELLRSGKPLTVRTTLDLDWQHQAEDISRKQLDALNHPPGGGPSHNVNNAALVALDPNSGEIYALLGNPDYFDASASGAVNMALAPNQPGSALKPIIYAAAFDPQRPNPWTPAHMILDVTTAFTTHSGQPYVPANYDNKEHGPVSARQALASSLNIPAVKTLQEVGLARAIALASEMGITTFGAPDQYDLSLALGGGAVRLLELTAAYASFDNGGYRVDPVSVLEITGPDGEVIYTPPAQVKKRVLDERVAWLVTDILSDDSARGIGFGLNSALKLDRPAAAKTGTTTNFHDNWTIGYTPDLVVGVWVGNADYQAMRDVTGLTGAGPIWHQFMRTVLAGTPETSFPRPDGLVQVEVCALSGLLPSPSCPYRRMEWFIQGTQPTTPDTVYKTAAIDTATGRLANAATPPERISIKTYLDLPAEAQPWASRQGITLYSDLIQDSGVSQDSAYNSGTSIPSIPLALVSPNSGSIFHLAADLPLSQQRILFEAAGEPGLTQVTFWLDGVQISAFSSAPYQFWWTLAAGSHQVWAEGVRSTGERIRSEVASFTVK